MAERRVERMSLAYAVPPDQRVVHSHRGLPWLIALLVHRRQDMEAGLVPRVLLESVPLIGPLPNLRQSFCNRTLLVFDMDGAGHNRGMHDELRAQKHIDVPAPSRCRTRRGKHRISRERVSAGPMN